MELPEKITYNKRLFLYAVNAMLNSIYYRRYNQKGRESDMVRKGFKMKLYPGMEAEYEKRHNELWPQMRDMIHEYGGKNYTIFLDRETLVLYGYIEVEDPAKWDESADTAINRKWWDFMADIMETNPDNSPVSVDLHEVFHLD